MESAFSWIGRLAEWFGQFFPRWAVIHPTKAVVKVVGWSFRYRKFPGSRFVVQRSGIVVWWPVTTELCPWPVVEQTDTLPAQTIETTDGKTYTIAGAITYEVDDVLTLVTAVWDADDTVRDKALAAIHTACIQYSAEELTVASRNGKLATAMRQEARARLKPLGVKVLDVRLTDLARCRVLRLVGQTEKVA